MVEKSKNQKIKKSRNQEIKKSKKVGEEKIVGRSKKQRNKEIIKQKDKQALKKIGKRKIVKKKAATSKKTETQTKQHKDVKEIKTRNNQAFEGVKTIVAKGRYLRSSTQKVGLVLKLIRGKQAEEAEKILRFTNKKAARLTLKVLKSAFANAKHNLNWKVADLVIKQVVVDPGPTHKRTRFGARGRVKPILKRTCHITIELENKSTKFKASSSK